MFIGLTFDESSIHHTKIESFRKRFDSKYFKAQKLQLTLIPPFSIDFKKNDDMNSFFEELSETLEGHLYGLDQIGQIEFNGITFSMGKKGVLALTPKISPDLIHCQESLFSLLKDYGAKFKVTKSSLNPLLPIGRFDYSDQLESAIEVAKVEFSSPFVMKGLNFFLFEKTPQSWVLTNKLFEFENQDHFFFVDKACLNY